MLYIQMVIRKKHSLSVNLYWNLDFVPICWATFMQM